MADVEVDKEDMDKRRGRCWKRGGGRLCCRPSGLNSYSSNGRGRDRRDGRREKGWSWRRSSCSVSTVENSDMGGKANGSAGFYGDEGNYSSRKRAKLQPKVVEDGDAMGTAMVPRRLRSTMSKRGLELASPPFFISNKPKKDVSPDCNQISSPCGARRFNSCKNEPITQDEEEVVEALTELAALITGNTSSKIEEDRNNIKEDYKSMNSTSLAEDSKEIGLRDFFPCSRQICKSESRKLDDQENGFDQLGNHDDFVHKNEEEDRVEDVKLSKSVGDPIQIFSGNGSLRAMQLDVISACKLENGLSPIGPNSVEEVLNNKFEEKSTDLGSGFPNNPSAYSTKSSSYIAAEASTERHRLSSTTDNILNRKLVSASYDKWRRSSAHVYIAHVIQNYQNREKSKQPQPPKQSKLKDGNRSSVGQLFDEIPVSRYGLNGMVFSGSNASLMDIINVPEGRFQLSQNPQAKPAPTVVELCCQQEKQVADYFSLFPPANATNSGHRAKSPVQLHVPSMNPQAPQNYSIMSFPPSCTHQPYTTAYRDHDATIAASRVQLQFPHYIDNPFFCGQQITNSGNAAKRHQHLHLQYLWQSQMAYCRSPISSQLGLKWQNGSQPPPSSTFSLPMVASPVMSPSTATNQQVFLFPPPTSARGKKQQQHEGFMEHSSHLQLLCNIQQI